MVQFHRISDGLGDFGMIRVSPWLHPVLDRFVYQCAVCCQFKPRLLFDVSWSMHAGIGGDYQTTWVDASFSHVCFNHVVWCWLKDSLVEKVLSLWAASEWWVVTTETKGVAVLSTPNSGGIYDKYNINISNNSGRWSYLDLNFVYSRYSRSFEVDSCWIVVVHYVGP